MAEAPRVGGPPSLPTVMKALTLTQPWASLVAEGHKRVETRSWNTAYRGPLAIHAAKGFPGQARRFAECERSLGRCPARIPLGAVVAIARLSDVRTTECAATMVSGLERHLGNFQPGRWAWFLEDIVALDEPIPARGSLGLWLWNRADGPLLDLLRPQAGGGAA